MTHPCPYFNGDLTKPQLNFKEARYKIIQSDRFSWKNHIQTYRYDDSKYTKMILGYHATFFATCIWKLHEIQFWSPNLYSYMMWLFHVWKRGIYS